MKVIVNHVNFSNKFIISDTINKMILKKKKDIYIYWCCPDLPVSVSLSVCIMF